MHFTLLMSLSICHTKILVSVHSKNQLEFEIWSCEIKKVSTGKCVDKRQVACRSIQNILFHCSDSVISLTILDCTGHHSRFAIVPSYLTFQVLHKLVTITFECRRRSLTCIRWVPFHVTFTSLANLCFPFLPAESHLLFNPHGIAQQY